MSSNRQPLQEERLQEEIQELRSDLGATVEALVHKADLPARAKDRGNELKEEAIERGIELRQQTVEVGSLLAGQAIERGNKIRILATERGRELRDRAIDAAERARAAIGQTPTDQGAKLVATGALLITLMVLVRRVRRS
jgi:hypothetical protein